MVERFQNIHGGSSGEQRSPLAQRLRQGTTEILKDLAGLSVRLIVYASSFAFGEVAAAAVGFDRDASITIGAGAIALNTLAGEFYYMRRLARVLPLIRTDRSGWWDEKRDQ